MYFVIYPYKKPLQSAGVLFLMKGIFWLTPKKRGIHNLPDGQISSSGRFQSVGKRISQIRDGDDGEFISL